MNTKYYLIGVPVIALLMIATIKWGVAAFIFGLVIVSVGCIMMSGKEVKAKEAQSAARQSRATFYPDKNILCVRSRGPEFRDMIEISEAKNYLFYQTPEQIHFGAVSVGGLTTGGFYKTGGEMRSVDFATQKCTMNYIGESSAGAAPQRFQIRVIELSPSLKENAKQSKIKEYLDENNNITVISRITLSEADKLLMEADPRAFANSLNGQDAIKKGYPSREKCTAILNWLRGND